MSDQMLLDQGYAEVMRRCIETGLAPHYTELAAALDVSLETARALVHDMVAVTPGWVHPGTDLLASFPPFNLLPTQYVVTVEEDQKRFAQCGFEALAVRWLFPGKQVRIEAPCLCCGDPMVLAMRDESITTIDPEPMVGYTSSEVGGDPSTRPFR